MPYQYPTRKVLAELALLENPQGISGREIDFRYYLNSGRNEVAELERNHGIAIHKTSVLNHTGNGYYTVYSLPNRTEAEKVIKLLNGERVRFKLPVLTTEEINNYLSRFKGEEC